MVPAVAVKFALLAPEGTVTDAGTGRLALLLLRLTLNPPVPAALVSVTVQVVVWPVVSVVGVQESVDN